MKPAASVFKAYDIRGIVGQTIDEHFAEHLGRAFGSAAVAEGERAVVIGRDGRMSGPGLCAALSRGLASTGLDVVDLGAVTTPMLYYAAATRGKHGCRSGIQVTGSHNPKDYNGFKMVLAGRAIYGDDIQRLRQRIEAENYVQGQGRTANAGQDCPRDFMEVVHHRRSGACAVPGTVSNRYSGSQMNESASSNRPIALRTLVAASQLGPRTT